MSSRSALGRRVGGEAPTVPPPPASSSSSSPSSSYTRLPTINEQAYEAASSQSGSNAASGRTVDLAPTMRSLDRMSQRRRLNLQVLRRAPHDVDERSPPWTPAPPSGSAPQRVNVADGARRDAFHHRLQQGTSSSSPSQPFLPSWASPFGTPIHEEFSRMSLANRSGSTASLAASSVYSQDEGPVESSLHAATTATTTTPAAGEEQYPRPPDQCDLPSRPTPDVSPRDSWLGACCRLVAVLNERREGLGRTTLTMVPDLCHLAFSHAAWVDGRLALVGDALAEADEVDQLVKVKKEATTATTAWLSALGACRPVLRK